MTYDGSDYYWEVLLLPGIRLVVGKTHLDARVCTHAGTIKRKDFKTLEPAQRYCIREAKKLHKVIGDQLDQLAKEAE